MSCSATAATCLFFASAAGLTAAPAIQLKPAWEACKIERPVTLVVPPDDTGRHFLVQQRGQIKILPEDRRGGEFKVFLDLSDRRMEENQFEEGLLGLAFHPQFKSNRKFYLYYSLQDPKRSVLSEWQVSAEDPSKADVTSERVLLEIPQPYWNHNSGNLLFGPDGMLYVAVGDGGKSNDAARLAQNLFILNGKILRLDVDTRAGARAYGLPKDNPFIGKEGTRPEIWASGLRNPWGIAIDPETKLFWCADVGQDLWEEINLIEKGGNYGWSFREGTRQFVQRTDAAPENATFIEPIHEYVHTDGLSITGGYVYRGKRVPALSGHYVYGDWANGRTWALHYDAGAKKVTANHVLLEPVLDEKNFAQLKPTAFCPDAAGEMIILNWNGSLHEVWPKE